MTRRRFLLTRPYALTDSRPWVGNLSLGHQSGARQGGRAEAVLLAQIHCRRGRGLALGHRGEDGASQRPAAARARASAQWCRPHSPRRVGARRGQRTQGRQQVKSHPPVGHINEGPHVGRAGRPRPGGGCHVRLVADVVHRPSRCPPGAGRPGRRPAPTRCPDQPCGNSR